MTRDIVVIGAGGFGRETLDVIEAINASHSLPAWRVVGVVDDSTTGRHLERLRMRGVVHLGRLESAGHVLSRVQHVVAIGDPSVRARMQRALPGKPASALVHPRANIGSHTTLGDGVVVCAGAQLSTNVRVGPHTHVNPGAIVGHDAILEEFVSLNPGAIISGEVTVGAESLVGAGAVVLQGLAVGRSTVIGAQACVTRDVNAGATIVGVPARRMTVVGDA